MRVQEPVDAREGGLGLRLDTGVTLDTDLLVLTAGGRPSTALARGAGLTTRRGIVVDDRLRSVDDPDVHAIGDCAEHDGRTTGFVPPAWEQAGLLADHLAGGDVRYCGSRSVARLRATGLDVAVLGDPEGATRDGGQVVEVTNPVAGTHRKLVVRDDVIVAGTFVGDLSRIGLITQYYDRGTRLSSREPGALLLGDQKAPPSRLADDTEICACAGVSAGRHPRLRDVRRRAQRHPRDHGLRRLRLVGARAADRPTRTHRGEPLMTHPDRTAPLAPNPRRHR